MVLQAYFDESADSNGPPTTLVLAGFVSTAEKWTKFSFEWNAALVEDGLKVFKSKSQNARRCERYYRIVEPYIDAQIYCIVDVRALTQAVDEYNWPQNVFLDLENIKRKIKNPYHLAFKNIIRNLVTEQERMNIFKPVNFIFDSKTESQDAMGGYDFLKHTAPSKFLRKMGAPPVFLKDHENPPLQAADLYAGYLRKAHLANANLKTGHPFDWPMNRSIHTMYMYLSKNYFLEEFDGIMSQENLANLQSYYNTRPPRYF